MRDFLQSRTTFQWLAISIWLGVILALAIDSIQKGRVLYAIATTVLYVTIFVGAAYMGSRRG